MSSGLTRLLNTSEHACEKKSKQMRGINFENMTLKVTLKNQSNAENMTNTENISVGL